MRYFRIQLANTGHQNQIQTNHEITPRVFSRSGQFLARTKSFRWLLATCDLRFLALKTVSCSY